MLDGKERRPDLGMLVGLIGLPTIGKLCLDQPSEEAYIFENNSLHLINLFYVYEKRFVVISIVEFLFYKCIIFIQ